MTRPVDESAATLAAELPAIQASVEAGLLDPSWLLSCPLLEPLRGRPVFPAALHTVERGAAGAVAAYRHGRGRA